MEFHLLPSRYGHSLQLCDLGTEPLPKRGRSNGPIGADTIDVSLDSEPPPGATRSPEERRRAAEEVQLGR